MPPQKNLSRGSLSNWYDDADTDTDISKTICQPPPYGGVDITMFFLKKSFPKLLFTAKQPSWYPDAICETNAGTGLSDDLPRWPMISNIKLFGLALFNIMPSISEYYLELKLIVTIVYMNFISN